MTFDKNDIIDKTMSAVKRSHLIEADQIFPVVWAVDDTLAYVVEWLEQMDEPGLAHDLRTLGEE